MTTDTATLFVSTVSDEFRSYRDAVAKWLDRPRVRVETQEKFIHYGDDTLSMLDDYIRQCDAVIHLVGDLTGSVANEPSVQKLLRLLPYLPRGSFKTAFLIEQNGKRIAFLCG